jgi:hypothetical protein
VLAAAVAAWLGVKVVHLGREMEEQVERMQEMQRRQRAARERLRALDEAHPSRLQAELAGAVLDEEDVARYLALHAELAEPIDAHLAVLARVEDFERLAQEPPPDEPSWSHVREAFSGMKDALAAGFDSEQTLTTLLEDGAAALERLELGPTELRRLCSLIDWLFLRRDGLDELALPAEQADELRDARWTLDNWDGEALDPEVFDAEERASIRADLEAARETVQRLEAASETTTAAGLGPRTRELLERRRAELQAVSVEHARWVLELAREGRSWSWLPPDQQPLPADGSRGGTAD